jgi:putative ABC transport system ATP-binding protein
VARVLPESSRTPDPDPPVDHSHEREASEPRRGGAASPIVELVDIHKRYQTGVLSVDALRGVSLRIDEGEFVAIIGPSGSGKSTLMHILGCLDHPSSGSYYLAGVDVSDMDEVQLADVRNRRIGFVFQQFNLLNALTACRNVELPLVYAGIDRHDRKQRALASLARVDLANRSEHRPNELSGGQQQRVAVARALVNEPTLVLADEPTGNLDSSSAADVLGLLGDLHRSGRTVVLITHDAQTANTAQRVVRLKDGLIQSDEATSPGGHHT